MLRHKLRIFTGHIVNVLLPALRSRLKRADREANTVSFTEISFLVIRDVGVVEVDRRNLDPIVARSKELSDLDHFLVDIASLFQEVAAVGVLVV